MVWRGKTARPGVGRPVTSAREKQHDGRNQKMADAESLQRKCELVTIEDPKDLQTVAAVTAS